MRGSFEDRSWARPPGLDHWSGDAVFGWNWLLREAGGSEHQERDYWNRGSNALHSVLLYGCPQSRDRTELEPVDRKKGRNKRVACLKSMPASEAPGSLLAGLVAFVACRFGGACAIGARD